MKLDSVDKILDFAIEKEEDAAQFYTSISIDRMARTFVVLAGSAGGVDIEEVAEASPDSIAKYWVDTTVGFDRAEALSMISRLSNLTGDDAEKIAGIIGTVYRVAMDSDAEMV